ncbi:DUF6345 domain-containing protein [Cellulomonas rhizosphaerae]|uniref:CHAT domain-containing protein n=1 Tax=Cellulomonas rhizosphaerae TaxID=2293719 RepID=A0A413RR77_9CELL|nr:DUF6345 domain-containing protein [Cellulomonas rhizosphaerae]RHA44387.1 hypothetical protein D1825_01520 [Cellulomonas rhizosphaerae]
MSYSIGVEWINAYNNLNALHHEHEDAGGFYDELRLHDGATGLFNWGDSAAWEDDFKANARGGHADQWVERADIVYFTGHGSPSGFYFRSDTPDDSQVRGDFTSTSSGNDGDLRLGHNNIEWLALEVCNTLQMNANQQGANRDVFDRWADAFEGLHAILSFTTTSLDLANPGKVFAAAMDGRWISVAYGLPDWFGRSPMRVVDAWFWMAQFCQPSDVESAVLFANSQGTNTGADFLHGHGAVSPDPVRGQSWFSWTWIPHAC